MDFCPAFWDWLVHEHASRKVLSVEKVLDEIRGGNDELTQWAEDRGTDFFMRPNSSALPALRQVSNWAGSQHYEPAAVSTFLSVADYYVVSQALAGGHAVVTHEKPSPSTRKIKIPDVCIGLNIKCVTPFEMLRTERARFVLNLGGS